MVFRHTDSGIVQTVQEEARRFFSVLDPLADVQVSSQEDGVFIEVRMEEPQMFIGEKGQTLSEVQHLLRAIVKKKTGELVPLYVDINNYRKNRDRYLKELALTTADEVSLLRVERELPPMPPAERRVIHEALAERQDVVSESKGDDPWRQVVVRPRTGPRELEPPSR